MELTIKSGKLTRSTRYSAGYDLYCGEDVVVIPSRDRRLVKTGLVTSFTPGHVGLIRDRSGHAFKAGVTVLAGVIDPDYALEWGVILLNTGKESFVVRRGDRIAQVLFIALAPVRCIDIEESQDERQGGFGSTG